MSITDRMKKYAENRELGRYERGQDDLIFADLQAAIQALEVAREALVTCQTGKGFMNDEMRFCCDRVAKALKNINELLGENHDNHK